MTKMEPLNTEQEQHLDELRSTIDKLHNQYSCLDYNALKAEILSFKGDGVELVAAVLALKKAQHEMNERLKVLEEQAYAQRMLFYGKLT